MPRAPLKRLRLLLAVVSVLFSTTLVQFASASSERTLSFHNMHTGEDTTVTYKRDGRYIPAAMQQLNYVLRDWRLDRTTTMDPRLIDLVWEIYQQTGSNQPINIISGYRSPDTNEMLRETTAGVAEHSQHMLGKAMDIQIPGVDLTTLRNIALRMQVGGVGFYPTSGWPFIHVDVGSVRNWPRLTRTQLAQVFPDGHSLYIPDDGVPLPGYNEALAAYQTRGNEVVALYGDGADDTGQPTRVAGLFGGGNANQTASAAAATVAAAIPATVINSPPAPRPATAGITVTDPAVAGEALAFAPATDVERDPLAILTEAPVTTAALPTPSPRPTAATPSPLIQRDWYDPLVQITLPSIRATNLPFLGTATVRQAAFAQLTAPDISNSPQFLVKPDRVMAVGFMTPATTSEGYRFAGPVTAEHAMIDLTRMSPIAAR